MKMETLTIADYLINSMKLIGIDDVFGVPGDFVLGLLEYFVKSKINYIGTCNELNAAYAADGYARVKGAGAIITTYAVGELSALNGVAGAWAENIPLVVIVGCPSTTAYHNKLLLHHTLGNYNLPKVIFSHITKESVIIDNSHCAQTLIDNALKKCILYRKPVYIGICSDLVFQKISVPKCDTFKVILQPSDEESLEEVVDEIIHRLNLSKKPVVIPGIDMKRMNLDFSLDQFLKASGLPYATMIMGKSVLSENHPQHLGLYCGDRSRPYVQEYVESSDCILLLGEKLTDFNTGGFTAALPKCKIIDINTDSVTISHHRYHEVNISDVLAKVTQRINYRKFPIKPANLNCVHRASLDYTPLEGKNLTMSRFFDKMAKFIPENSIVIAETGSSLFSACEVLMPEGTTMISQSFYGSIGYTVGACLGVSLAEKNKPVILFVGDGSFQVTCQELSTIIRYGCKPLIFLLNNDGYTIERVIKDNIYNNIQMWEYHKLPKIFGHKGNSVICETEDELDMVLNNYAFNEDLLFVEIVIDKWDCNESLKRAGSSMAKQNSLI